MSAWDRVTLVGECNTCQQTAVMQLDGMDPKLAKSNLPHWLNDLAHFCPGPPDDDLPI